MVTAAAPPGGMAAPGLNTVSNDLAVTGESENTKRSAQGARSCYTQTVGRLAMNDGGCIEVHMVRSDPASAPMNVRSPEWRWAPLLLTIS
jgi:hypothetical protein